MTPVSYYVPTEFTSPKFAYAFARGCNGTITDETELFPGPVALFGSPARWPLLRAAQQDGREWFYGDHGYMGRRRYYRVTRNAYQHDGRGEGSAERFRLFGRAVYPWRRGGAHVLVCPNSAVYCGLHGFDVDVWLRTVIDTLKRVTDREIRVRWKTTATPIKQDLIDAWAVVVYSSAAAIDALIEGVPVFVLAPFAAPARMGLDDLTRIESPVYPDDREPFLHVLANNQWTLQELWAGVAWRALQMERRRAA